MSVFRFFLAFSVFLTGLNFLITSEFFKENFYSKSKIGYFYLSYDWSQKKSRALLYPHKSGVAFFGSSPTVYSIDPSLLSKSLDVPVYNFGLLGSSLREVSKLMEIHKKEGAHFDTIFVEYSPLAISKLHLDINASADFAKSLNYSKREHWLPLYSWLDINVPLVKYGDIIRQVFADNLTKRETSKNKMNEKKTLVHHHEFLSLINNDNGHISNSYPLENEENKKLKEFLVEQCKVLVEWNFQDGVPFENEESVGYLKKTLALASELADKVYVWIPPFHSSWHSVVAAKYYENSLKVMREHRVEIIDLRDNQALAKDELFVDCAHQSKTGSIALNKIIGKTLLKTDSK